MQHPNAPIELPVALAFDTVAPHDPRLLTTATGEPRQDGRTAGMGSDPPRCLRPGDTMSIKVEAIGTLINPGVAEQR